VTLGTDVVVRSLYYVLGNMEHVVELWKINKYIFSIPFILIHSKLKWSNR